MIGKQSFSYQNCVCFEEMYKDDSKSSFCSSTILLYNLYDTGLSSFSFSPKSLILLSYYVHFYIIRVYSRFSSQM